VEGSHSGSRRWVVLRNLTIPVLSAAAALASASPAVARQVDGGTHLSLSLMAQINEWVNPPADGQPLSAKKMVELIRDTEQSRFTGANSVITLLEKARQQEVAELEEWRTRPPWRPRPGPRKMRDQERKIEAINALLDCLEYPERCDGVYRIEKQREKWKRTGDPLPQDPSVPTDAETLNMLEDSLARNRRDLEGLRTAVDALMEAAGEADSALGRTSDGLDRAREQVAILATQSSELLAAMRRLAMDGTLLCDAVADLVLDATRALDRAEELNMQLPGQLSAVRGLADACASDADAQRLENLYGDAQAAAAEIEAKLDEAAGAHRSAENRLDEWTRALAKQPDRAAGDELGNRSTGLVTVVRKDLETAQSALQKLTPVKAEVAERLNRYSAAEMAEERAGWERIYADDPAQLANVGTAFDELQRSFEEWARQGRAGIDWSATLEKEPEEHRRSFEQLEQSHLEVAKKADAISLLTYPECSVPMELADRLAQIQRGRREVIRTMPAQQWVAGAVSRCRAAAGGASPQRTPVPPPGVEVQNASFEPRDYTVSEDGGSVLVVVRREGGTSGELRVDFSTRNASAEAGTDYIPVSRTLVWGPGTTTPIEQTIVVSILEDAEVEREETIHMELANPRNDTVQVTMDEGWEGTIRIVDNDESPVQPTPRPVQQRDDVDRTVQPPEPSPYATPISDADDRGAVVPPPPADAYTWFVVCQTQGDRCAVAFTEDVDHGRHEVLSEALPGPRTAEQWIDVNCPSGRCTLNGSCADRPVRGGEWAVLCNTGSGEVTLARAPSMAPDREVMAEDFCGEPDARWWVEDNCPSWRCDTWGQCATGPVRRAPGGDGWYVVCYLPTGDVEIGKGPFDPTEQTQLAGPFLGEPDARQWANQNYPTWLCSASSGGSPLPDDRGSLSGNGGASSGGFAERGQSDARSELKSDFVAVGSAEALALLSKAQRDFYESRVKGRGFSDRTLRRISEEIARDIRRQQGEPPPNLFATEEFKTLVDVAIWQITGHKPPGLGGDTGPSPPGGGAGGRQGGGSGQGGAGPRSFKVVRCAKRQQAWGSKQVETYWCFCLGPGQAQPAGWDRCEQVPGLLAEYDCKVKANRCIDELPRTVILE